MLPYHHHLIIWLVYAYVDVESIKNLLKYKNKQAQQFYHFVFGVVVAAATVAAAVYW